MEFKTREAKYNILLENVLIYLKSTGINNGKIEHTQWISKNV